MAGPTPPWFEALVAWAQEHGRWDFVQTVRDTYVPNAWVRYIWFGAAAAELGYLDVLQWFENQKKRYGFVFTDQLSVAAAENGHLHILQWMRTCTPPWPWNATTCANAARGGHGDVLLWLRTQGCPWNERVCAAAAAGGHLDILRWLQQQNCPWDEAVCTAAARNGHLEVLQWAREHGVPWDQDACVEAVVGGHLPVVQWLRQQGCPWPDPFDLGDQAALYGHFHVLQWLMDTGGPRPTHQYSWHWHRRCEYYRARQGLTLRHSIRWSKTIQEWLAAVDTVSCDVLERLLCPDLVHLIQRYT